MTRDRYTTMRHSLTQALRALESLAGDDAPETPADAWQANAAQASAWLRVLALEIEDQALGRSERGRLEWTGPIVFPSPREILDIHAEGEHPRKVERGRTVDYCGECGEEWPCTVQTNRGRYRADVVCTHTVKR